MDAIARRVASPNGTTEAGLAVLDRDAVLDDLIAVTIDAPRARRGAELAEERRAARLPLRRRCPSRRRGRINRDTWRPTTHFDDRDGFIWMDGELVVARGARSMC